RGSLKSARAEESGLPARKEKTGFSNPVFSTHSTTRTRFFQQPRQGPPSTRDYHTAQPFFCQSPVLGTSLPGIVYVTKPDCFSPMCSWILYAFGGTAYWKDGISAKVASHGLRGSVFWLRLASTGVGTASGKLGRISGSRRF